MLCLVGVLFAPYFVKSAENPASDGQQARRLTTTSDPTSQPSSQPTTIPSGSPTGQPSDQPSDQPSGQPSEQPSGLPTAHPSSQPSMQPIGQPTCYPTAQPSSQPAQSPTSRPSAQPSDQPSMQPVGEPSTPPTAQPSVQPSVQPSGSPIGQPSGQPSCHPSAGPTAQPSLQPSGSPTVQPSAQPSGQPTGGPTGSPTGSPSAQPSAGPSAQPSGSPSAQPSAQPFGDPSACPSGQPSIQPSGGPTSQPSASPSCQPTGSPTAQPSGSPTAQPSGSPTSQPTIAPSMQPSVQPSAQPTAVPSSGPSSQPSVQPSDSPSAQPTSSPTTQPSNDPTTQPTGSPTMQPTGRPSMQPSGKPTGQPSEQPSTRPTVQPSTQPSVQPSGEPSLQPSGSPTCQPSAHPSSQPSGSPTGKPSVQPSGKPSCQPSGSPTTQPSGKPSTQPSASPSAQPSAQPSGSPTLQPSSSPTTQPSGKPSGQPSGKPSAQPTDRPSMQPSASPTSQPSEQPSGSPTLQPTSSPTTQPSGSPTSVPSSKPSMQPSGSPTRQPSGRPSMQPTSSPTVQSSVQPTGRPSSQPSGKPSTQPSAVPSTQPSDQPTSSPSMQPSVQPTARPSAQPSGCPSGQPSGQPSRQPSSRPTTHPSSQPSRRPTAQPSHQPSTQPTGLPTVQPTSRPSCQPSAQPSRQPSAMPTSLPTCQPSGWPSAQPSGSPTTQPSGRPSTQPTGLPTCQPSGRPSSQPSRRPTSQPSEQPTRRPSGQPTRAPSGQPSGRPSSQPSGRPTTQPSRQPSRRPTTQPSGQPSVMPSRQPSEQPTSIPSGQPSGVPTVQPSAKPSNQPSAQPSSRPSTQPSMQPTGRPSMQPSLRPTSQPSSQPSMQPSAYPTDQPTNQPTSRPSMQPTVQPSGSPTGIPSMQPSARPSSQPTNKPSTQPSMQPSCQPSDQPSARPTGQPTGRPSTQPSCQPSLQPTSSPSCQPSSRPTRQPSMQPSSRPTVQPSSLPTAQPSTQPSTQPTRYPSSQPSSVPTEQPTMQPTCMPSSQPSCQPSAQPTNPTSQPSRQPTSRPSMQPSQQPSSQPTRRPSSQPSTKPSGQPSGQPSSQPSQQPTRRPTRQPSGQPTARPSMQPSCQPSIQPTSLPTTHPTVQPSSQPSAQPSRQPSSQPSRQPSRQPTSRPTRQPTSMPSRIPTAQPTSVPSRQPTRQPTSRPSSQPSRQPSSRPTGQPSSVPSMQPSTQPTSRPTCQPSSQPSRQPSSQPSRQPSTQPSEMPSSQPTVRPTTSRPTSRPTSGPSKYPTTSHPTRDGNTNRPTKYPTSAPTYNIRSYTRSGIYADFLSNSSQLTALPSSLTFSTFFYKGLTVSGSCSEWTQFNELEFNLPYDDMVFTKLSAWYAVFDYDLHSYRSVSTSCTNSVGVKRLVNAIRLQNEAEFNCDGNSWRVFNCNKKRVFCINCKKICTLTESCPGRSFITNPCESCTTHAAMGGVVNFQYQHGQPFPAFNAIAVTSVGNTSLTVTANVTNAGLIRCAAFPVNQNVSSTLDVYNAGYFALANASTATSIVINGRVPATAYKVLCYTESFAKEVMSIDESKRHILTSTTACCKTLAFITTYPVVRLPSSQDQRFAFALTGSPSAALTVTVALTRFTCSDSPATGAAIATPAAFTISTGATDLVKQFVLSGLAGCYTVQLLASGSEYASSSTTVRIVNVTTAAIPAPTVALSRLENDGGSVGIYFTSPTSVPYQVGRASFACSLLLSSTNVAKASCRWTNSSVLMISSVPTSLRPGDVLAILANKISASCDNTALCSTYPRLATTNTTVLAPLSPPVPVAALTAQRLAVYCDDLFLDATASSGSGGRAWDSIRWDVQGLSAANLSIVRSYMNDHYQDISAVITVPNAVLFLDYAPNSLTFILTLTNYLGMSTVASALVTLQYSSLLAPRLSIAGPPRITMKRSAALVLFANATIPSCLGVKNNATLKYIWSVFSGSTLMPAFQSISKDQRFFKLPSSALSLGIYTVQLKMSLNAQTSRATMTTASVSVTVGSSGVIARIAGGSSQVTYSSASFYLDGRQSYDIDSPSAGLMFAWTCSMTSPAFGGACPDGVFPINISYASLPLELFLLGTYSISLKVTNADGLTDSTSMQLTIVRDEVPVIFFNQTQSTFNREDKIIMTGMVTAIVDAANTIWSSTDTDVSKALAPISSAVPMGMTRATQLVLSAFSLDGGDYAFVLSAGYAGSTVLATASMEITVNQPPRGGILTVSPLSGVAVTTIFTLSSSLWTDDPDDLPLSTLFAYFVSDPKAAIILKGLDAVSTVFTPLGQGLKLFDYQVKCMANVSDIHGAQASVLANATVTQVLATASASANTIIINAANAMIAQAKLIGDVDQTIQAMGTSLTTINSADCSTPSPCWSINRQSCTTTLKTCGACLEGYVGVSGDSNVPCDITLRGPGESCANNGTCFSGSCLHGACQDVPKACPANCIGRGLCQFADYAGRAIPFCSASDPTCTATCKCNINRYAKDCSLTLSQFNQLIAYKESMCSNLLSSMIFQDVSNEAYKTRAKLAADILVDDTMVSPAALFNCSKVLIQSVNSQPELSCQGDISGLMSNAFSNVLTVYRGNDSTLLTSSYQTLLEDLLDAVALFSVGCQGLQTVNERAQQIVTANLRASTVVHDLVAAVSLPLTAGEVLSGRSGSTLLVNASSTGDSIGVTVLQYTSNPRRTRSNSSSIEVILTNSNSRANALALHGRRLDTGPAIPYDLTIVLPNFSPVTYTSTENYTVVLTCRTYEAEDYTLNTTCSSGLVYTVTCPAGYKGTFNVTCPAQKYLPVCSTFNGMEFVANPSCTVLSYNSMNTTCSCTADSRRRLQAGSLNRLQFASVVQLFTDPAVAEFTAWPGKLSVLQNTAIVITTAVTIGCFLFGLLFFIRWDYHEQEEIVKFPSKYKKPFHNNPQLSYEKRFDNYGHIVRTIQTFFQEILPNDFYPLPWKTLFYRRLLAEHSYLGLWAPYEESRGLRSSRWTLSMCKMLNLLCLNTILASFLFADNGQCDDHMDVYACEDARSVLPAFRSCQWVPENETCVFKRPDVTFLTLVLFILFVTLAAAPLNALIQVLIHRLYKLIAAHYLIKAQQTIVPMENDNLNDNGKLKEYWKQTDELHDCQEMNTKLLRSARLRKIQQDIDFVLPSMEAELLLNAQYHLLQSHGRAEIMVAHHHEYQILRNNALTMTSQHSRYALQVNSSKQLGNLVDVRRRQADYIKQQVEQTAANEREILLMQYFIIHNFHGYQRHIVARHLIGSIQTMKKTAFRRFVTYASVVALPLLFIGMLAVIVQMNFDIGQRASDMWLLVVFIAFLEDILLIQPCKLFTKWIIVTAPVRKQVYQLCMALRKRYVHIVNRRAGNMHDLHALVQHMNPACRAARLFPDLPIARLLFSLNDYDVPYFDLKDSHSAAMTSGWQVLISMPTRCLTAYSSLPTSVQDMCVEMASTSLLNLTAIAFFLFGVVNVAAAIVIAILLVAAVVLFESKLVHQLAKKKVKAKAKARVYEVNVNEEMEEKKVFKTTMKVVDHHEALRLKTVASLRGQLALGLREAREHNALPAAVEPPRPALVQGPGPVPPLVPKVHVPKQQQSVVQMQRLASGLDGPMAPMSAAPSVAGLQLQESIRFDQLPPSKVLNVKTKEQQEAEEAEMREAKQRAAKKTKKRLQQQAQDTPTLQKHKSLLPDESMMSPGGAMESSQLDESSDILAPSSAPRSRQASRRQMSSSASGTGPGQNAQAAMSGTDEEAHLRRQARRSRRMDRNMSNIDFNDDDLGGVQHELARFDAPNAGTRDGPGSRRYEYASSPSQSPVRQGSAPRQGPPPGSGKNQFPTWH